MSYDICGENKYFNYDKTSDVKMYGLDKFYCLTEDDYSFMGNFYNAKMSYLEMKMYKCSNDSGELPVGVRCKDMDSIDKYFDNEVFSFAFVNTMFEQDNYENPLKYFIDDQLFYEIDPSTRKMTNFLIK